MKRMACENGDEQMYFSRPFLAMYSWEIGATFFYNILVEKMLEHLQEGVQP